MAKPVYERNNISSRLGWPSLKDLLFDRKRCHALSCTIMKRLKVSTKRLD